MFYQDIMLFYLFHLGSTYLLIYLPINVASSKVRMSPVMDLHFSPRVSDRATDTVTFCQMTEVKLGGVSSNSGWVTSEAWPRNSLCCPSEETLN